jgi:hypothetical protein
MEMEVERLFGGSIPRGIPCATLACNYRSSSDAPLPLNIPLYPSTSTTMASSIQPLLNLDPEHISCMLKPRPLQLRQIAPLEWFSMEMEVERLFGGSIPRQTPQLYLQKHPAPRHRHPPAR